MIYILDTDIMSLLAHRDSPEAPRIRRRIAELPPEDEVVTTVINYEEQMRGWMAALTRAKRPEAQVQVYARLLHHLQTFRRMTVLPYDTTAAAVLAGLGKPRIGSMDLKIASIVLAAHAVLITRNTADFRRVPGLRIEDWSAET
jgi:tRNA(fMet)-specific endonuclease VapC